MFCDVDESEVRETIDEQISEFIDEAYYTYPKEYNIDNQTTIENFLDVKNCNQQ